MNINENVGLINLEVKARHQKLALSLCNLFLLMFSSPSTAFKRIKCGGYSKEIIIFFVAGFLISFAESFQFERQYPSVFDGQWVRSFMSLLSDPQLNFLIQYSVFFLFAYLVSRASNSTSKDVNLRRTVLLLMSISAIAIPCHIVYLIIKYTATWHFLFWYFYLIYSWAMFLTVRAISIALDIPLQEAFKVFVLRWLLVAFVFGFTAVVPSLHGITTKL